MGLPEKSSVTTDMTPATAEMLKEMLVAVLKEARKPAEPTEAQAAEIAQSKQMRADAARLALQVQEMTRIEQETCSHLRRDGTTTGVYVENGNFIICQQCRKVIRPENELALFNRLFQMAQPSVF